MDAKSSSSVSADLLASSESEPYGRAGVAAFVSLSALCVALVVVVGLFVCGLHAVRCHPRLLRARVCQAFRWRDLSFGRTSHCCLGSRRSDWVLFATRCSTLAWAAAVWAYSLWDYETAPGNRWQPITSHPVWTWFMFNTNWGYFLLVVYFTSAVLFTMWHRWHRKATLGAMHERYNLSRTVLPAELWIWVTFQMAATSCACVTALYWVFFVGLGCSRKSNCRITAYSYHAHGIDVLWMALEMTLNSFSFSPMHCVFPTAFISLWIVLTGFVKWLR
eukprot:m51a1_g10007 hypothetical protein (276) ;mRNA; r:592-2220